MVGLETIHEMTSFESLVPTFSESETEDMKLYFETSEKFRDLMESEFIEELKSHPTWGEFLKSIPEDVRKKNSEISNLLQRNAIFENQWLPYIQQQIQQGVGYAQQGLRFSSWYELVNMVRDFMIPLITKEFDDDSEKLNRCLNGMNRFFDFAMSVLGEAYIYEKRRIIAENMKKQEKLNKELESFAYIISHDLKTPLRGISSLSEWIIQDYGDKLDEKGHEYLELLKDRVKRMEDLIEGVLIYSRVGRVDFEKSEFELKALIEELVEMSQDTREVKTTFKGDFPVFRVSKTMMTQLFGNLIDNAIKYCDKDVVELEFGATEKDGTYTFYIKDNGPGIAGEFHNKVFQIFHTLDTKDENKSTGIGLTIVKKIVDIYGGKIEIKNPPEGGSIFEFTLENLEES